MFFIAIFNDKKVSNIYWREATLRRCNEFRSDKLVAILSAESKPKLNEKVKEALKGI